MNVPADLKYSSDHEWCRLEGDTAVIGITDFAQSQLGDIVFVDVPTVGETLAAGEVFGSIEAVKTVSDAFLPGEVPGADRLGCGAADRPEPETPFPQRECEEIMRRAESGRSSPNGGAKQPQNGGAPCKRSQTNLTEETICLKLPL